MKRATKPRTASPASPARKAEILVPIEGGGSVAVRGDTAEIRDAGGRVVVRFAGGTAEIAAPDGDLVLSAPRGKVVIQSGDDITLAAGPAREAPQVRVGRETLAIDAEQIEAKTAAGRLVAEQASVLARRITTTATTISHTAERFELTAQQLVEHARDAFRTVTELSQTRAGRVRTLVDDLYALYTKRTSLQSTEETSVDGSKVLLG
ncbi:MAG: DUF3540 domain-containing protein [Polyangiaceae bacterium]